MRRAGFSLIELMVLVGIIALMLAGAVMSVAAGRGAVKVREATRGVIQLSRYASSLALLRQRPVVVTFHKKGKVEVRISGEVSGGGGKQVLSDPIYLEVDGEPIPTAAEMATEEGEDDAQAEAETKPSRKERLKEEQSSFFFTRRALDLEELAKEDAEGEFEGVTFIVEVLDEEGNVLPPELAAARSLKQPERKKSVVDVFNSLDINSENKQEEETYEADEEPPVCVTYETNGSVNPHRIIVRLSDESQQEEGFAINVDRTGKVTVGDDENDRDERRNRNVRRRR